MNERVAVIGSNSFSGSHFVARLIREGFDVLGLSRSEEVHGLFRPYSWEPSNRSGSWNFVRADLNAPRVVEESLVSFDPGIVVNFGAQSMVAQSWAFPEDWYQTNVVGIAQLSQLLERLPSLTKYVHVTTPEVYGTTSGWIKESWHFHPSTPYAISRAAGDFHLRALHETRGLPVCFTRAANVYGPGQQLYRIVPRALLFARTDRKLLLEGDGSSIRSFIHISDVVEATLRIAQHGTPGEAYHISTTDAASVRELVEAACTVAGVTFEALAESAPERPGKDQAYLLDSSKIRSELAWKPEVGLTDGLLDTLAWIDENLHELSIAPDQYVHRK